MYKVFFKKFFGPNYGMLFIGLFLISIFAILGSTSTIDLTADSFFLANSLLTVILSFQTLTSKDNAESFNRLFTYPLNPGEFKFKYITSLLIYNILTRNLAIYSLYITQNSFKVFELILFLLSCISTTLTMVAIFMLIKIKRKLAITLATIAGFYNLMIFGEKNLLMLYIISIVLSLFIIIKVDYFTLRYVKEIKNKEIKSQTGNFFVYIYRYFKFNKSYIFSSISMLLLGCMVFIGGKDFVSEDIIPSMLVLIIYNVPLSFVISINKDLQKKIKSFPNQFKLFYFPYFLFCLLINIVTISLFFLATNTFTIKFMLIGFCLSVENSILTTFLEYKFPIKNWNTETELWNHPRKYIIISLLISQTAILSTIF